MWLAHHTARGLGAAIMRSDRYYVGRLGPCSTSYICDTASFDPSVIINSRRNLLRPHIFVGLWRNIETMIAEIDPC